MNRITQLINRLGFLTEGIPLTIRCSIVAEMLTEAKQEVKDKKDAEKPKEKKDDKDKDKKKKPFPPFDKREKDKEKDSKDKSKDKDKPKEKPKGKGGPPDQAVLLQQGQQQNAQDQQFIQQQQAFQQAQGLPPGQMSPQDAMQGGMAPQLPELPRDVKKDPMWVGNQSAGVVPGLQSYSQKISDRYNLENDPLQQGGPRTNFHKLMKLQTRWGDQRNRPPTNNGERV